MKKLILILGVLCIAVYSDGQDLNIHTTDGEIFTYNIAGIDSITFSIGNGEMLLDEDFESYPVGTFPSSGGWELMWNGAGNQYQVVTDEFYHSAEKSMQMKGQPGWSARMIHELEITPDIIYLEYWIKSPGSLGIDNDDGGIGLLNQDEGTWGTYYVQCGFNNTDGQIVCNILGYGGYQIETYNHNQWYKFKIKLDFNNESMDVWINDALKVEGIEGDFTGYDGYKQVAVGANHGNSIFYYDDIKVWY